MKTNVYRLFNVMTQVRARPQWPTGEKLHQLTGLASRFWFVALDNQDGTFTVTGPTLTVPLTLDRDTTTIRLLNEVCSAILAEDGSDTIYALAEPLMAPFVINRKFLQRRVSSFRKAHRDYEATYYALTQPQPQPQGE